MRTCSAEPAIAAQRETSPDARNKASCHGKAMLEVEYPADGVIKLYPLVSFDGA
jgi:hypothetical protein